MGGDPLVPGPWCLSIPRWDNPALASPANPDSVDVPFADFRAAGVDTLGGLLAVERAALASPTHAEYERGVRGPLLAGSYAFAERHVACERAALLRAALPAEWVGASSPIPSPHPSHRMYAPMGRLCDNASVNSTNSTPLAVCHSRLVSTRTSTNSLQ